MKKFNICFVPKCEVKSLHEHIISKEGEIHGCMGIIPGLLSYDRLSELSGAYRSEITGSFYTGPLLPRH